MSEDRKQGRPSKYTPELAERICNELVQGKSLRNICEAEDMPERATVLNWVASNREGFFDHYIRARQAQIIGEAEELRDLADEARNYPEDNASVNAVKLAVETRKWTYSKLLPKVYGDKIAIGGDKDNPLEFKIKLTTDETDG